MKNQTVFWDVDTQFDFMRPQGKLYVPGAEKIIEKVSQVRRFALENGFSIVASTDWHDKDNPEISHNPDLKVTFPPHCMAGQSGSERVGFLGQLPVNYIETEKMDLKALKKLIDKEQFHVVIRKESVDVFSNPNTAELVHLLKPKAVAVFGVALDICVYHTVHMLSRSWRDKAKIYLLKDAVKGLDIKTEQQTLDQIKQMGIEITRFSDFQRTLKCG